MGLEDYKEIVASCIIICTVAQMLAGTLICKDIYGKGSSKGFDPMPFLGGTGMCILMLQYVVIIKDFAMINVHVIGLLINAVYMAIYYYYSPEKKDTLALIGKVTAFITVLLAYAQMESPEKIEFRFGLIVTVLLMLLVASPLLHLGEVIKTKNTDILPFPLILTGTIVSFLWLIYGIIIDNGFIINSVVFVLSVVQLSLFVIYPSKSKDKTSSPKKTN